MDQTLKDYLHKCTGDVFFGPNDLNLTWPLEEQLRHWMDDKVMYAIAWREIPDGVTMELQDRLLKKLRAGTNSTVLLITEEPDIEDEYCLTIIQTDHSVVEMYEYLKPFFRADGVGLPVRDFIKKSIVVEIQFQA